jgi:hypothetical protein
MATQPATDSSVVRGVELAKLLDVMKRSDSVELKASIDSSRHRATIASLPIDPVEAQPRQVFFFDTPDLDLAKAGIVVRARRIQGGRGDAVIKLRPVDPDALPTEIRRNAAFNVEVDVLPGAFGVCSGTFRSKLTGQEIRDAVAGVIPLRRLFTKEQRAFYRDHAPAGIELDGLVVLGPTFVLKAVWVPKPLGRPLVGEMWLYPDGSRILELSTKCLPGEAFQVAAEARAYLASHGVEPGDHQETKTKAALEYFAARLRADAAGAIADGRAALDEASPAPRRRSTRTSRAKPASATPDPTTQPEPTTSPAPAEG